MRIEVEKQISETVKEIYGFNLFDTTAVFVEYHVMEKPKGKRVWKMTKQWDKYRERDCSIRLEPELPDEVKVEAGAIVAKMIKVQTWKEYKNDGKD